MLQLQITIFLLFVHKFCCFSSSLHRMNKGKTSQRLSELTHLTNPTKTIENSIKVKRKPKRKNNSKFQANEGMITPASQSPSSLCYDKWAILGPDFYQIDALDLAPRLLGKFLKKDDVVLQITEVEAYRPNDSACHARFGITSRTAPVFGPGGHTYVYLCYGLHTMLNIVADKEGVGAAVLIRSCAPVNVNAMNVGHPIFNDFLTNMGNYFMDLISGLETIQQRRGLKTEKPVLLTGPGKEALIAVCTKSKSTKFVHIFLQESFEKGPLVGQALGISTEWSNHPLFTFGGLELLDGPEPEKILVGPRVGIEYALPEHVTALWRFAMAGTQWISAPKNTLRAP